MSRLPLVRLLAAFLFLVGASAGAQTLPAAVQAALQQADVPVDHVAMVVAPVGDPAAARLDWRTGAPMSPASVMKTITTYAGLELLGPDYLWKTRLYALGPVVNGVLHGNLLIRGGGDPKLVWDRIEPLFDAAHAAGLQRVEGDIVLDRDIFRLPPHDPAAFDGEADRPYNAGPDGLLVNFKSLTFKFTPVAGRVQVESEPPLAGVRVPTRVRGVPGACGDWRAHLQADLANPDTVTFAGGYPLQCGAREWSVAYVDPNAYAPRALQALWEATGGSVSGRVRWGQDAGRIARETRGAPWVTGDSLPLADIIRDINLYSNNVMAQQLFLTLSAQNGATGTFTASAARVDQWWRAHLAPAPAPVMDNGSGLSREGRVTAGALAALLQRAASGSYATIFQESLPIAGVSGTARFLSVRDPQSDAIGRARIKTGTLRDVVAIAGYVQGLSGRQYVVVGLINDANAERARPALDRLLEWAVGDEGALQTARTAPQIVSK